jgi:WD40 repeat protein
VLDFGLAKLTADAVGSLAPPQANARTLTGQFLGSLPWAAPEQIDARSKQIDTRTDVYSLGVLLFQMLTSKFPYPVICPMKDAMEAILHAEPLSLRRLRREINDELETIVLKCLSKEPERRYQTAGELGRDVQRYLNGAPIDAKRDSAMYVLRKTVRRYRAPLGILATFVLLLAVFSGLSWTLWLRARDAAQSAQQRLRESLVAQARATRQSGRIGQRFKSLDAIAKAAQIEPTIIARNEAIAAMTLCDLRPIRSLHPAGIGYFDPQLERCAVMDADGSTTIVRTSDDVGLARIPAPACGVKQMHAAQVSGQSFVRVFDPPEGPRRLEVWDIAQGTLVWQLIDIPDLARFDISPDGQRLVVGRLDQAIHVYSLESANEIQCFPLEKDASYMTFDPSGQKLVLYHGNFVGAQILDLRTGEREPAFESASIRWSVAWHPEGSLLAGASGSQVELWNTTTRRKQAVLQGHEQQVVHVRFSHDGTMLLTFSLDGQTILWDSRTHRPLMRDKLAYPVFSRDDTRVGGTSSWESPSHAMIFELGHAFERRCLVGSDNPESHTETRGVFDPQTGLLLTASVSNDIASCGLRVFDVAKNRELSRHTGDPVLPLAIEPLGRFVLAGHDDGVYRWPISREGPRLVMGPPEQLLASRRPNALDLSPRGEMAVAAGYGQDEFTALDLQAPGGRRHFVSRTSQSGSVRISSDARFAAVSGRFGSPAMVWDLRTETKVLELPNAEPPGLAFSPDGKSLVTSSGDGLSVWETGSWRRVMQKPGHSWLLRFSPDGRILASLQDSTAIGLYDGQTFEQLAVLESPEDYSTGDLVFSHDGAMLAQVTNRAGLVYLWDMRLIRERLHALGLDWALPAYEPVARSAPPESVEIEWPDSSF